MAPREIAVALLLLTAMVPAWPQGGPSEIKVRVSINDDRPAPKHLRVELVTSSELYITSSFTDDEGRVEFSARPGNYRLRVSGMDIEESVSPVFTISRGDSTSFQHVRVAVKGAGEGESKANSATVSQATLNITPKARKEYEKAGKAMKAGDWAQAKSKLEHAIALYPPFAAAHNDLGVVFMSIGDKPKGRAAFERALEIEPNYGRAFRNLAIMKLSEGNPAEALALAEKSAAADPLDPQALLLVAQVHLQSGRMEDAAAQARKVHDGPHDGFAVAHLLAARALEARNLSEEAVAEYKMFLKEAPNSASTPQVRAALEKLTPRVN